MFVQLNYFLYIRRTYLFKYFSVKVCYLGLSIIEKIVARALELGMKKTDIIVDGLVATVGANKQAALETLETIRYCHRNGLATTCGLSNISFGLPERSCVNSAFLTMAIASGLTMAIANPSQDILVGAAFASDL